MSVVDIDDADDDRWLEYVASLSRESRSQMLVTAAAEGELWRVERLAERGADKGYNDYAALFSAAGRGREGVTKFLLQDQNIPQDALDAALNAAVTADKPVIVGLLLARGANAAHSDSSALWHASLNGSAEVAELLLKAGADATSNGGALMGIALSHRHDKVALLLLHHGADPSHEFKGRNAFEWAGEMHLPEFSASLREWVKGDVYTGPAFFEKMTVAELRAPLPGRGGRTGLHLAASSGAFDVVRDTFIASGETLRAEDLLHAPAHASPRVLDVLAQTGQLDIVFDARLWAGRKQEMLDIYAEVPAAHRTQVDIESLSSAIDRIALQKRARSLKPGLKLGLKPGL